jgi:DNA-nicking Smr family endonuclease
MGSAKAKGPRLGPEDEIAWWWITLDVVPLPGKARPARPPHAPAKVVAPVPEPPRTAVKPEPKSGGTHGPALRPGEAPGLDRASLKRLTRGRFPVEDVLDLHGHTRVQAHGALDAFLASRQGAARACVIVVTGRGRTGGEGVLRELVPRWLNEPANRARVLGFATALPRHGGAGALYVLLRRKG